MSSRTRGAHLFRLRKLFDLLADHAAPPRPDLLLSEDIPRPDQTLPRPLTPEDDVRPQAELRARKDLLSNTLLLTRLTGMRIGETVDLSVDCLRHPGGDDWALHVPIGKLHNVRWVPVDEEVRTLVGRLRFLATLPPRSEGEFLLPRPEKAAACFAIRCALPFAKRPRSPESLPIWYRISSATPTLRRCCAPVSVCPR